MSYKLANPSVMRGKCQKKKFDCRRLWLASKWAWLFEIFQVSDAQLRKFCAFLHIKTVASDQMGCGRNRLYRHFRRFLLFLIIVFLRQGFSSFLVILFFFFDWYFFKCTFLVLVIYWRTHNFSNRAVICLYVRIRFSRRLTLVHITPENAKGG